MESRVYVYLYDLSKGLARSLSHSLLGTQIDGIWHTGVVVYNQEYFFGGQGVESCAPGHTILGNPDTRIDMGVTEVPFEVFWDHLHELSQTTFRSRDYNLLQHNCNNFSSELAQFLTGRDIPSHITNLPSEVLATPFGQMIQPYLDSMTVDPGRDVERCFSTPSQAALQQPERTQEPQSTAPSQKSTQAVQTVTYPIIQLSVSEFKTSDQAAITILLDYQQEKNPDWSVSPKHLVKLRDAVESTDREVAWRLFQGLVLHSSLTSALEACYEQIQAILTAGSMDACKTVCNLSSHKEGVNFIDAHPSIIQDLFSPEYSHHTMDNQPRIATAYNISNLYEPRSHDLDIALTSGLVEYINTSLINRCIESPHQPKLLTQLETALKALTNFMNKNTEMKELVACLELDLESIRLVSSQSDQQSLKKTVEQLSNLLG